MNRSIIFLFSLLLVSLGMNTPTLAGHKVDARTCLEAWEKREKSMEKVTPLMAGDATAKLAHMNHADKDLVRAFIRFDELIRFRCKNFSPPPIRNPLRKLRK